jgi:hypothetical protein
VTEPPVAPRVVVYGEYPPFPTPGAAATLVSVQSYLAAGREIEVVSPQPSAAHHHADAGNPKGAAKLALIVGGAEFVARLDPGILRHTRGAGPVAARTALALAVRRAGSTTIYFPPLTTAPAGKWVRSILGPAERVVVATQEDADRLRAAGLDAKKVDVAAEAWWLPPAGGGGKSEAGGQPATARNGWGVPSGASREELEAEVRLRAAGDREDDAATPLSPSWPLQMLMPLTPAPTESSRPLFRLIKRYVHRLVAWEVVPIVEQVNHLHRATIESFDRQAGTPAGPRSAAADSNS